MKPFISSAKQRILEVLFLHPEKEFSLSDMAKAAKVAKPHVSPILMELEKEDIIEIRKLSTIWRITAKREDKFFRLKMVYNLHALLESGIIETISKDHPKAIILFGSYRFGEDVSTSDIDIAVEDSKEYRTEELRVSTKNSLKRIQLHHFSPASTDKNVLANIANGIVLAGSITWTTRSSSRTRMAGLSRR